MTLFIDNQPHYIPVPSKYRTKTILIFTGLYVPLLGYILQKNRGTFLVYKHLCHILAWYVANVMSNTHHNTSGVCMKLDKYFAA